MAAPLEHKHIPRDPGEWDHFWQQFQYRWECDNDDMDDIWVEGQSWTEPACGFIPSVLTRLDHLTEAGSEDPEISLRVHLVDLNQSQGGMCIC